MPNDAESYLRRKRVLPSELRTREWDAAHKSKIGTPDAATLGWCKERAFFMAAVTRAEQLESFRTMAAEVARGSVSPAEARQKMREWLTTTGYQAKPGQEGTLKDLGSTQRLKVSIDTNVELARGWAQRKTSMANYVRPAQILYRASQARQPRDWRKKWAEAAETVGWEGVSRTHEFVALKTSPIWRALSRFDQPYPPFDFGSKMRVRSVSLKDAQAAGLLTTPEDVRETQEEQRRQALAGMNESVECTPQVSTRELREELSRVLQGLAEWKGDTLVMADPNGTRPYPPEEIGRVITAPLPKEFEHRQAKAFREWVKDSSRFDGSMPKVGTDMVNDVQRLFERIECKESTTPLYRGLHFENRDKLKEFEKKLHTQGYYSPRPDKVADSFSSSVKAAGHYASKTLYQAIVVLKRHHSARDLRALYKAIPPEKKDVFHPVELESEHAIIGGTKLKVLARQKEVLPGGVIRITYECEES